MIWETTQRTLEPLRDALNKQLGRNEQWEEWQIPRAAADPWPDEAAKQHAVAEKNTDRKRNAALSLV